MPTLWWKISEHCTKNKNILEQISPDLNMLLFGIKADSEYRNKLWTIMDKREYLK